MRNLEALLLISFYLQQFKKSKIAEYSLIVFPNMQMFGFVLYVSEYAAKIGGSKLVIPKVCRLPYFVVKITNLYFPQYFIIDN